MVMKKKFAALIVLFLLVLPGSARALETNELIAMTAMPLAVAAVADLADVPTSDLVTVVSTLNRAEVAPTRFVEIVRYSPVAFVETREPRFATYVTTQYDRGIVGNDLAYAIANEYPTYGVREINIVDPPVITTVVEREILPQVVVTRFQTVSVDPLALIAMPLAVAAVSEMTDVPRNDLISLIAALNGAYVPAPQFVEVIRYSPVMLVDRTEAPLFLSFVTTEIDRGVIGRPLAYSIANRIETFGIRDIDIVDPPMVTIVDRDVFIPPVVVTRVANVRTHPHGGPPGQLKKDLGLQTGAEVVHGTMPSRSAGSRSTRPAKVKVKSEPQRVTKVTKAPKTRVAKPRKISSPTVTRTDSGSRGKVHVSKPPKSVSSPKGGGGQKGNSGGQGNSGGGKGKGKGKG
jgi:hypothetical protein